MTVLSTRSAFRSKPRVATRGTEKIETTDRVIDMAQRMIDTSIATRDAMIGTTVTITEIEETTIVTEEEGAAVMLIGSGQTHVVTGG